MDYLKKPLLQIFYTLVLILSSLPAISAATSLNITSNPNPAQAGQDLMYKIHFTQGTGKPCSNATLTLDLPAGTTYVSSNPNGAHSAGKVTWNLGRTHNTSGNRWATVSVDGGLPAGTKLNVSANISGSNCSTNTTQVPPTAVQSAPTPILSLSKAVSKTHVDAGGQLVYTLSYQNTGSGNATGVVLKDQLPANVTFKSATGGGTVSGGVVTWNLGLLTAGATGSVNVTVAVKSPLPNGTVLANNSNIDSNETVQVDAAQVDVTIDSSPVLRLSKSASKTHVNAGGQLVYTLGYQNIGSDQATGVILKDQLPANVTFSSATGGGTESGGVVTWNLSSLTAGAAGSVNVTVAVKSPLSNGTVLTNNSNIDSNETAQVDAAQVDVTVDSTPVLTLGKSASKTTVIPGEQLVYTLSYQNVGTDQATNVVLEDHLPTGVTFKSASGGGTEAGGIVTWNLSPLAAGLSAGSVTVTVEVNSPLSDGTILHNTSILVSTETPTSPATAFVNTTVDSNPVLTLSKSVSKIHVKAGDQLVYTLAYQNTGSDQATNIVLEDHLPTGVTFISATGTSTQANGIVTWDIGTLVAGASGSVTVTVDVNSPISNGTVLHNSSTINSTQTAPVSAPVVDVTVTVMINHSPVITSNGGGPTASIQVFDGHTGAVTTVTATDADNDHLTYKLNGGADASHFDINASSGVLTFKSPPDFNSPTDANSDNHYQVTVQVDDGKGGTADQDLTVQVALVVTATPDTYSVSEDGVLNVPVNGVLANDHDANNDPLTAVLDTDVSDGVIVLAADGRFTYTPTSNFSGTDTFSYHANNGALDSNIVTVTITVNQVNDPPVAQPDAYATPEDTPLTVTTGNGVLHNDIDPDVHDTLHAIKVTDPAHGSLTLNSDGSLTYTPDANYNGPDSFTYKANDGHTDSNTVTVDITVNAVNDNPIAQPDSYGIAEDTALKVGATLGLLRNDTDPDGDHLSAVKLIGIGQGPYHGLLQLNSDGSFEYTPDPNFNGNDGFLYYATDGKANSAVREVFIYVSPINDPPVALPDAYSAHEDTGLSIAAANGLLKNDHDPEHSPLRVKLVNNVSHGTLHLNKDGSFDYTPAINYNGPDSFTYQANDGQLDSSIVTVKLTIDAVNDAPIAVSDTYTVFEDTLLTVDAAKGLLANDSDPDGDSLIALLELSPTNGIVQFNLDGSFSYHPDANFNGTDFFSYKANDGKLDSTLTIVNITVRQVNDAPLAGNDSYSTQEDTAIKVTATKGVLSNDIDFDGDLLKAFLVSPPGNGQVNFSLDGGFIYTPDVNFNGVDSFTYKANDGQADSSIVTVTINIHAVNDAPVAADDSYSVGEDGFLKVTVAAGLLANDHDLDGNVLRVGNIVTSVSHGALQVSLDGSFTYKPAFGFFGTDSFTYKATDGKADSNEVTVTITVNHVNHPVLPNTDAYTIAQDGLLTVTTAHGLLANDLDIDGDTLLVTNIPTSVSHGTLQMVLDGSFTYTPTPGYSGPDSFTYTVNDGSVDSGPVTVSLTVTHTNHEPLAADDVYSVAQDGVLTIPALGLLANDLDVDGDKLFVLIQSFPANGALHQELDGGFTYQPAPGFQGVDSYTYMASDSLLNSAVVTVTLHVNHTNHAPLAGDDSYSTARDAVLQISSTQGVLANDIDLDADALTALIVSQPANGTVQLNKDGSFKYTPALGYAGLDSFSYKVKDSLLDSNIVAVVIDVHFTNRPPVATDDNYSIAQDTLLQVNVANGLFANDTDPDANTLQPLIVTQPANGIVHVLADGSFSYQPTAGFTGSDSFTYKANDGNADSNIATVSITVNAVNHPPIAKSANYTVTQGIPLQVSTPGILAGATDPDGDQLTAQIVSLTATGSLHLNHDGSFTYTAPQPTVRNRRQARQAPISQVSFTFVASDGNLSSPNALVTIDILPPPTIDTPIPPTTPAKPIPTLSQWALILLSMLMLIVVGRFHYRVE